MAYQVARAGVVDRVWQAAADGRWHSRRSLVQRTRFEGEEVMAALHFLVKYELAESSVLGGESYRMIIDGPSPDEAAKIPWAFGKQPDLTHFAWL